MYILYIYEYKIYLPFYNLKCFIRRNNFSGNQLIRGLTKRDEIYQIKIPENYYQIFAYI